MPPLPIIATYYNSVVVINADSLAALVGALPSPTWATEVTILSLITVVAKEATLATVAKEATLATVSKEATQLLVKAKTDNLDVLLSTRTKPADQQHALIDSSTSYEAGGQIALGIVAVEVTFVGTPRVIIIQADSTNTGLVYVGTAAVSAAGANAIVSLQAGDAISLSYNDTTNPLYVVASVVGQNFIKGALLA